MADPGTERERELVAEGIFFALFRVVEIDELWDAGRALDWARGMIEDRELRQAFGDGVIEAVAERAQRGTAVSDT